MLAYLAGQPTGLTSLLIQAWCPTPRLVRQVWLMFSGQLVCQSLYLAPMKSLPVVCSGVSCSARLCHSFLRVSRGLGPSSVLKGFLLVLLQGSTDGVLD